MTTRIRSAVASSGVRQESLASHLHMSRQALQDRLRGRTRWTTQEAAVLARVLGVRLVDLLDDPVQRAKARLAQGDEDAAAEALQILEESLR